MQHYYSRRRDSPIPLPPQLVAERADGLSLLRTCMGKRENDVISLYLGAKMNSNKTCQDDFVPLGECPVAATLGNVHLQACV